MRCSAAMCVQGTEPFMTEKKLLRKIFNLRHHAFTVPSSL